MSFVDGWLHRLRVLARGNAYDDELREEMQFHVELETQALSRQSATPHDDARRAFGNQTYYREEVRSMTALGSLERMRQDLSYAWRGLRRERAFTAAVIVTLALGLGVNAAVYSVIDRIFVQAPAGVPNPGGLRRLYIVPGYAPPGEQRHAVPGFSYASYDAVRDAIPQSVVAAYTPSDSVPVATNTESSSARLSYVTASYFQALAIRPTMGRFFAADEDHVERKARVVVISDALWQRLYHKSLDVIGSALTLDGDQYTIIGITPPDFTGVELNRVDLWIPFGNLVLNNGEPDSPWYLGTINFLRVIVRPAAPITERRLDALGSAALRARMSPSHDSPDTLVEMLTGPLVEARGPAQRPAEMTISTRLAAVALIVLLIAVANVANLLLLRGSRRQREMSIRRALGVSSRRLIAQLLTESLLLAFIAGSVAVLIGAWGGITLRHLLLPRVNWAGGALTTDTIVLCGLSTLVIGIVVGLAPALGALRFEAAHALRDSAQSGYRTSRRGRSALLILQAAFSVVLLVGAGLFVRSLQHVDAIDIGYAKDELLLISPNFSDGSQHDTTVGQALPIVAEQLGRMPGVRGVALTTMLPMRGYQFVSTYVNGSDSIFRRAPMSPTYLGVSPTYFATAGIRLLKGRNFLPGDRHGSQPVVIVSRGFARTAWPGESALGKCVMIGRPTIVCTSVIGIVEDAHQFSIVERPTLRYYLPIEQSPNGMAAGIIVRAAPRQLASLTRVARDAVSRVLPSANATYVSSMSAALEPQTRPWRLGAELFSALGALAVVIAAIGIYSVVAHGVSQRLHEIGVRIALGARTADILELIIGAGLRLVLAGIAIGVITALILARSIKSLLYGVATSDPVVLILVALMLVGLGAIACLIPAFRASRIDPAVTLRTE